MTYATSSPAATSGGQGNNPVCDPEASVLMAAPSRLRPAPSRLYKLDTLERMR